VLIELFSLGVMAEALRAIIRSKSAISLQRGPVYPKFHVKGVAHTNHSFFQKTTLSYGISRFLSRFVTIHAFDGRTDRRTDKRREFSSLDSVCIPCSAVKMMSRIYQKHCRRDHEISLWLVSK